MKQFLFKQLALVLTIAILMPLMGIADDILPNNTLQETIVKNELNNDVVKDSCSSLEDHSDSSEIETILSADKESKEIEDNVFSDEEELIIASNVEPYVEEIEESDWVDLVVDEDDSPSDTYTMDNKQGIPFDQTVEIDEVSIRVTADLDSFPEGSTLWAEECIDNDIIHACVDALELSEEYTHYLYRIEVHDASGNAILPFDGTPQPTVHMAGLCASDNTIAVCYRPVLESVFVIDAEVENDTIVFPFSDSTIYDIIIPKEIIEEKPDGEQFVGEVPTEDQSYERVSNERKDTENEDDIEQGIEQLESDDSESESTVFISSNDDVGETNDHLVNEEYELVEESQSTEESFSALTSLPSVANTLSWEQFADAITDVINEYETNNSDEGGHHFFEGGSLQDTDEAYDNARLIVWVNGELQDIPYYYNVQAIVRDPENHYFLQFENSIDAQNCSEYLATLQNVSYVEPDQIVYASNVTSSNTKFHSWGVEATHADEYAKYLKNKGGQSSVVVAVVDSGIYSGNELFLGRLVPGYDFVSNDDNPEASGDHGTHVAGTIAECTMGLNIRIMPVRVLKKNIFGITSGSNSTVAQGIRYAVRSGAKVINLSLGGPHSEYIDEAIQYAIGQGVTVVAAAGNDKTDASYSCPAHIDDCITVSAIDSEMNFASKFSNYGPIDISAPGVNISGASGGGFKSKDGTSMAAPHVSAAAAMVLYEYPSYSPDQIKTVLRNNATDLGTSGWDPYYGAGFLNLRPFIKDSSPSIPDNNDLSFNDVQYPNPYIINPKYGWKLAGGTVYSSAGLKTIKSVLLYDNSQQSVLSIYGPVDISGYSFSIKEINTSVKFSQITQPGKYIWRLTATDNAGHTKTHDMFFTAQNPETGSIDSTPPDSEKPAISNVNVSDLDSTGYTVTCTVSDNVGVTRVSFHTSQLNFISIVNDADANSESEEDGNYVEYEGTLSGNTATVRVRLADFVIGSREFVTDIYAYDAAGNIAWAPAYKQVKNDGGGYYITPIIIPKENPVINTVPVTGVSIHSYSYSTLVGKTGCYLYPEFEPSNATNRKVKWESRNPDIATVEDGMVTGVSEGTATITITTEDGGKTASCTVTVENAVPINETTFPDPEFRRCILNNYDEGKDGFLSDKEIQKQTMIWLSYANIQDITGIEYFTNLSTLHISGNQLSYIDLSNNQNLESFSISSNEKPCVLDISKNYKLKSLYCAYNQFTNLDLSNNVQLTTLDCRNNQLSNVNIKNNYALTNIYCENNKLTSLDLTGCPKITRYINAMNYYPSGISVCYKGINEYNNMSTMVLSCDVGVKIIGGNPYDPFTDNYHGDIEINSTFFPDNNFRTIISNQYDTDKNGYLSEKERFYINQLRVDNKEIKDLAGIEFFPNLWELSCKNNLLTYIYISKNPRLINLICNDNMLTKLDVSKNTELDILRCYNNKLSTLDLRNNKRLTWVNCYNNELKTIHIGSKPLLYELNCSYNNLDNLELSTLPRIVRLYCSYNNLTSININNCSILKKVDCRNNQLVELNIESSPEITQLLCNGNNLKSINIKGCPNITKYIKALYYRLSGDKSIVSYEKYIDRKDDDSDTSNTYLACDSFVSIIGGEPIEPIPKMDSTSKDENKPNTLETSNPAPSSTPTPMPMPTISVTKKNAKATIKVGTVYQIDLGENKGKYFKSSKKKIITVNSKGIVTPKSAGKARITFKVGKKKHTLTLTVKDLTIPTSIILNMTGTNYVEKGGSVSLTYKLPDGTNSPIKWKSSNKRIATVSANGVVKFKKKGKVTITATCKRGNKKAKVKFIVEE